MALLSPPSPCHCDRACHGRLDRFALALGHRSGLRRALLATVPTTGDFGLTWDEPAYRYSQSSRPSGGSARRRSELGTTSTRCSSPTPCSTTGPTAGSGSTSTPPGRPVEPADACALRPWMKDIPARRMASVIEFALTITIGFRLPGAALRALGRLRRGRLAAADAPALRRRPHRRAPTRRASCSGSRRPWPSGRGCTSHMPGAGGSLVGDPAGPGVRREDGGRHGLVPLLIWLVVGSPAATRRPRRPGRLDRRPGHDGGDAAAPGPGLPGDPVRLQQRRLPPPQREPTSSSHRPSSDLPGAILAVPLVVWMAPAAPRPASPEARSGASSGPPWRPGRRSWRSPRSSAGWATPPGGARPCRGSPTIDAQHRPPRGPARHPDPLLRPDLRIQPPLAQRLGPDRDHRPRRHPRGGGLRRGA